ncbi:leucine-rich repeat domain-containing protein [Pseudanabaena sp. UWO310]|uniref:leucine-rich repeat domain-containing protein n=1 Tax=Pseudanabaena sp. UWO310 TaxID=2480795 RepID=UPI001158E521|nr:leucine-rich repeat domain-containing protein [Pseudanabaena sp. UWO310]TYQ31114.1 leucine-rich repeat domain-containing protein [Pseudanabaena sp. UWO310]
MANYHGCKCFEAEYSGKWVSRVKLHLEQQDMKCDGWKRLLELVEVAAQDGREEFVPEQEMKQNEWQQIITLPSSIAKLKSVKHLNLYGSNLVRIPPEIGEMTNLEKFTPYTSYRLHWFPYEITRCKKLKDSTVSIRALYGNYKFRFSFPQLPVGVGVEAGSPTKCSVCNAPISDSNLYQVWISLPVATDVLPLLVNACSQTCINQLPPPSENYVQKPHRGGANIQQPSRDYPF